MNPLSSQRTALFGSTQNIEALGNIQVVEGNRFFQKSWF